MAATRDFNRFDLITVIIYQNSIVTLEYEPATDILSVALPDIQVFSLKEVERCLGIIVEHVISYDVKKVLLDSSKAVVDVENEAYHNLMLQFGKDLMKTRLQKIARVSTSLPAQESRANRVAGALLQLDPGGEYQNFTTKAAALNWLLA